MDEYPPRYMPDPKLDWHDKHDPVILRPLEVTVSDGKIDKALRKLKRKMSAEGVLREVKRRRRAMKPSDKKRKKRIDSVRRRRKRERAAEMRRKG